MYINHHHVLYLFLDSSTVVVILKSLLQQLFTVTYRHSVCRRLSVSRYQPTYWSMFFSRRRRRMTTDKHISTGNFTCRDRSSLNYRTSRHYFVFNRRKKTSRSYIYRAKTRQSCQPQISKVAASYTPTACVVDRYEAIFRNKKMTVICLCT